MSDILGASQTVRVSVHPRYKVPGCCPKNAPKMTVERCYTKCTKPSSFCLHNGRGGVIQAIAESEAQVTASHKGECDNDEIIY